MQQREIDLESTEVEEKAQQAIDEANRRAEHAESELRRLRALVAEENEAGAGQAGAAPERGAQAGAGAGSAGGAERGGVARGERAAGGDDAREEAHARRSGAEGIAALREDEMMRHLLDSLEAGQDIGHYGRLVFAMIARHFLSGDDVLAELVKDRDFSEEKARALLMQVEERDYSPPRRERIMEWQAEQEFPILPPGSGPDAGNVYRTLKFPQHTYEHIEQYQEERAESAA